MKPGTRYQSLVIGAAMLLSAWLGVALKPKAPEPDRTARPALEAIVPLVFGDWRLESAAPQPLIPKTDENASRLYSEVLVRTYRSGRGERVMLSIAYGGEQRGDLKSHRPEFCYRGQGFDIGPVSDGKLATPFGQVPVRRLLAHSWERDEAITYWTTLGREVKLPGLGRHLAMFAQSLGGEIADGMLVRISSLGPDTAAAWRLHDRFAVALLQSVAGEQRARLAGLPAAP